MNHVADSPFHLQIIEYLSSNRFSDAVDALGDAYPEVMLWEETTAQTATEIGRAVGMSGVDQKHALQFASILREQVSISFFIHFLKGLTLGNINVNRLPLPALEKTFVENCRLADQPDLILQFYKKRVIAAPADTRAISELLDGLQFANAEPLSASLIQRLMILSPKNAGTPSILRGFSQHMKFAPERVPTVLLDSIRRLALRQTAPGTDVATLPGLIERIRARTLEISELASIADVLLAIGEADHLARVLDSQRNRPAAESNQFWSLVKRVQAAGASLEEGWYPFSIHLESVNACNASCVMCPVSSTIRRRKRMDDGIVDKVIGDIQALGHRPSVGLHGVGEPLLHKDLSKRIRKFRNAGINVSFSTNGQLMTEGKAREILDAGINTVTFSLETTDANAFEGIRLGLSHEVVTSNIRNFIRIRDELGAPTGVIITVIRSPETEERIHRDVYELRPWLSKRDSLSISPRHNFTGNYADGVASDSACTSPFQQFNITSDGLVTACCLDSEQSYVTGDIRTHSIFEIFNGDRFSEMRKLHADGRRREMTVCRDCTAPETWPRSLRVSALRHKIPPTDGDHVSPSPDVSDI